LSIPATLGTSVLTELHLWKRSTALAQLGGIEVIVSDPNLHGWTVNLEAPARLTATDINGSLPASEATSVTNPTGVVYLGTDKAYENVEATVE
jgi:hypothetical protein